MAVCEELHKYGANICINTVAHKGNLEDAYNLAGLIKKLDYINKWQIFQYTPLGKFGFRNREVFEISNKQFQDFQSSVLEIFDNDISKLQFKSTNNRNKIYMLIDNSGNAWIPTIDNKKTIIGNINKSEDWNKICMYLDREQIKI